MFKAALFDMDGVLNQYPDMFSRVYAKKKGLNPKPIEEFFRKEWERVLTGKVNLKVLLKQYKDAWGLSGDPQELLDDWFKTEDVPNTELLEIIQDLRRQGIKCYMVTNNEAYRISYIRKHVFAGKLDGFFSSAELGVIKPNPKFFTTTLKKLALKPAEVIYFDDTNDHVETAKKLGINAYMYENPKQVKQLMDG